jgi:hypothetical protein
MSTHALGPAVVRRTDARRVSAWTHVGWLTAGLALGFTVPFALADVLELSRDLFYGLYGAIVIGFVAAWAHSTGQSLREAARRRWRPTLVLSAVAATILTLVVYRTEDATARPDGLELVGALAWRGVFYGAVDGLLLSVFPILVVFAAFAGTRMRERWTGLLAVGAVALAASLLMTAVYHAGYSDFRGEKLRKPVAGDVVWSMPTLLTLNPIGAPIAHAAMHSAAVLHSYETDVFLPPHE